MKKLFTLLFSILFVFGLYAQDKIEKIDGLMNEYSRLKQFSGSVLVSEKGKVIYEKGFGYANMEWKIPNDGTTKFRLGSITKQFTAMLIMQLVERGKISLDGKISDYLPYYPKETGGRITIHELLNHTSGIFNYTNDPDFFRKESFLPLKPEQLTKLFSGKELEFEPGSKWSYSNSGYIVLGAIIEQVTGESYEKALQENIFTPLGMSSSGYDHNEEVISKRASGYEKDLGGYRNTRYIDMSLPYSAGSLYSTVEDMNTWGEALYTDKLVSYESLKKMMTPYMGDYGYGLHIQKVSPGGKDSLTAVGHSGSVNGFIANMVRILEDRITIILLSNVTPVSINSITNNIFKILYGKPVEPPKESAAEVLLKLGRSMGMKSAVNEVMKNKDKYQINENELNILGYQLMGTGKLDEAIEIFKLNVELFPDSWNVYDSLGEAYLNNGDNNLALENYRKSVELNSQNEHGKEVMQKLEQNK
jgi:CubicO group peptidase (beta-lactamase class C family)